MRLEIHLLQLLNTDLQKPYKNLEVNGRFCVEWNSFRRDEEGMKCLK